MSLIEKATVSMTRVNNGVKQVIRVRVTNFVILPLGSKLSLNDGEHVLFVGYEITGYNNSNHWGLEVTVEPEVSPKSWDRLWQLSRDVSEQTKIWPEILPMKNGFLQ